MIFSLRMIIEAFAVDPVSTQGHSSMSGQSEVAIIIIFTNMITINMIITANNMIIVVIAQHGFIVILLIMIFWRCSTSTMRASRESSLLRFQTNS